MPRYNPDLSEVHVALPACCALERATSLTIEDLLAGTAGGVGPWTPQSPTFRAWWSRLGEILRVVYPRLTPDQLGSVMWHRISVSASAGKGWPEATKQEVEKCERTIRECQGEA